MQHRSLFMSTAGFSIGLVLALAGSHLAFGHGDEKHPPASEETTVEQLMEMHKGHDHDHDFEPLENLSSEDVERVMRSMMEIGLAVPPMDAHHGRELFVEKGCVACHAVNGVGGEIGPSLDAADMPQPMNAFEFAARMWRGAEAMITIQQEMFGEQISLSGQELLDLVAFAHDEAEQQRLTKDQVPEKFREFIDN